LADIARVTNLRPEDAAFALNEVGLLTKRLKSEGDGDEEGEDGEIIITRVMVERVAAERKIKRMVLDLNCVLLPE
jgi:histone acetyltransferase HTATIP/histone acetyltransferase MYST1